MFVVNTLSQYMMDPRHVHLVAAKHVMRYLKGKLDCGLEYEFDGKIQCTLMVHWMVIHIQIGMGT